MSDKNQLIQESFDLIKKDSYNFANTFYETLLTTHPELNPIFAKTDMDGQKKKLMTALTLIVLNLRNPQGFKKAVKDLAMRHKNYGVIAKYFPIFGETLLATFQYHLQSEWTVALRTAWLEAYEKITQEMLEEMEDINASKMVYFQEVTNHEISDLTVQITQKERKVLEQYCHKTKRAVNEVMRDLIISLADKSA